MKPTRNVLHIQEGSPLHRLGWSDHDLMMMKGTLVRTAMSARATQPLTAQQMHDACNLPTECIYPEVAAEMYY